MPLLRKRDRKREGLSLPRLREHRPARVAKEGRQYGKWV
jgi:hypothetical protein